MNAQTELFENGDATASEPSRKLFRGANGRELCYWEESGNITRVAFSDKLEVAVTKQRGGHIYANVPGFGRLEKRNKVSFLSAAALISRAIEINDSIESKLKEQHELLSAASEIRSPPSVAAIGGRNRDATAEFSHRKFGPVITSFEGIEEYPLGTPSWLARREELEWSRKALYGQLRRWFGVLRTGCTVVKSNERVGDQVGLARKTVGDGLEELVRLRLIHIEGPAKGTRYVYFHRHPWMDNPKAIPTWAKLGQVAKQTWPDLEQSMGEVEPTGCPKFGHKETSNHDQNKERLLAPDGERLLLAQIQECLGSEEMKENGGMWRKRMRGGPKHCRALRNTIEDFKNRIRDPARQKIRHRAKWFTKKYLLNLMEIEKAGLSLDERVRKFMSQAERTA